MRKRWWVVASALTSPRLPRIAVAAASAAFIGGVGVCSDAWAQSAFTLTSNNLHDGGTVSEAQAFNKNDCKGRNQSPQLSWHNPPDGTKSFAVTMFDLDAPGQGWWHWVAVNIPASVNQLPTDASKTGYLKKLGAVEAHNDFDTEGYGGPCPPPGKPHRYIVTVYALDTAQLPVSVGRPVQLFDHEIRRSALGWARLTVNYGR